MNGYLFIKIQRLSNWIKTQKDSLLYVRGMHLKCSRREMGEMGQMRNRREIGKDNTKGTRAKRCRKKDETKLCGKHDSG